MRSRSNSGVRLDFYQRVVQKTIMKYQNPVTGLLPATPNHPHAWVRDNVYSILSVWGLSLAYRKNADLDEDRAKAYELEQSVVKLMRGLLQAMMCQIDKVERFKYTQSTGDSLHAKFSVSTGKVVVGDGEWGHLQLDATALYLLILAEMTASGLQIIYTLDEVAFVQNLVFYIQSAYRTPDYGLWERGDKTNHGLPELNASSIGMTKAALEALSELDLFGARGGPSSVIHVMPDETQQCQAILQSMLPRESNSKETDAGLLGIISYPAFAVDDPELIELTRDTIVSKLQGRYGCSRFLRDGYKTPKEDSNRLHYEPWELAVFENIECEWPMFFAYLALEGLFSGNREQVEEYMEALEDLMIKREDGIRLMPELYQIPADKVEAEYKDPKTQDRVATGKMPQMWGQSLYVLSKLLYEGFLSPGELDPLNRRLVTEPKPDLVVQVVILAENKQIQEKLAYYDLHVQTLAEVAPLQVYPARVLSHIFAHLGKSRKLGLTGRPSDTAGILATSKIYSLGDRTLAFMPQAVDQTQFYLPLDVSLMLDMFTADVLFLGANWHRLGRPLIVMPIKTVFLDFSRVLHPSLIATIKKLQTGYINGTRVQLGNLSQFISTSCVTNLTFLTEADDSPDLSNLLTYIAKMAGGSSKARLRSGSGSSGGSSAGLSGSGMRSRNTSGGSKPRGSYWGIIRRTCSIQVEQGDMPDRPSSRPTFFLPVSSQSDFESRSSLSSSRPSFYISTPRASFTDFERLGFSAARSPSIVIPDLTHLSPLSPPVPDSTSHSSGSSPGSSIPTSPTLGPREGSLFTMAPIHPHLRGDDRNESLVVGQNLEQYEGVDIEELIEQLKQAETLHEQADIIHYLYITKGADFDTNLEGKSTVHDLLTELYDKAGHLKQWWLVRHTAGMLGKQVEDLAKAATDILVRQKQLAVGLPPEPREKIITRPLPPDELAKIIQDACGDDSSTAMLTQEILVYLAMFIRTEPKLFREMLRIRVGLIIQVMASEMARTLKCSGEEASDQLMNLSPYEMKTLLHHILSGKEFGVAPDLGHDFDDVRLRILSPVKSLPAVRSRQSAHLSSTLDKFRQDIKALDELATIPLDAKSADQLQDTMDTDRQGQWLRRRRLDGALNRVPVNFYPEMWEVLHRCQGLSIESYVLPQSLTREMTSGELKFALQVEMALNRIPQPDYRQLMVEALMVLVLVVQHDGGATRWNHVVHVDKLVQLANDLFIDEQKSLGDHTMADPIRGAAGISLDFYDTAPSGRYGTMSYLCKAVSKTLQFPTTNDGNMDCIMS